MTRLYTHTRITTREALDIAQREHPVDLVQRVAFLRAAADTAETISDQACWLEALARTRGELPEGGQSDPRPDPRTHPEYWTE